MRKIFLLFSLFILFSVSTNKAGTVELKSAADLPLMWSIPVESCVLQAIVDDTGKEPYVKAIRTGYYIKYLDQKRKVTTTITINPDNDVPDNYTYEDTIHARNCPENALILSDGNYYLLPRGEITFLFDSSGKKIAEMPQLTDFLGDVLISGNEMDYTLYDMQGKKIKEIPSDIPYISCKNLMLQSGLHYDTILYDHQGNEIFHFGQLVGADISHNCQTVAGLLPANPGALCVLNGDGIERFRIPLQTSGLNGGVKLSPDGTHAAVATVGSLYFVDLKNGKERWNIMGDISGTHFSSRSVSMAISSDNEYVGFAAIMPGHDRGERLIVNKKGEIVLRYGAGYDGYSVFCLLSNGRYILFDDFKSLKLAKNPGYER